MKTPAVLLSVSVTVCQCCCLSVLLYVSVTVCQSYCLSLLLSVSITVCQCYCVSVLLSVRVTVSVLLSVIVAVCQCYCVSVLLSVRVTVCQCFILPLFETLLARRCTSRSLHILVLYLKLHCPIPSQLTTLLSLQKNIVHRDLKLGNLVLNRRTHRVTITNFCLGKHLGSENDLLKDQRGSPAYISPDVLCGKPYLGE